jgi:hypothetical protein
MWIYRPAEVLIEKGRKRGGIEPVSHVLRVGMYFWLTGPEQIVTLMRYVVPLFAAALLGADRSGTPISISTASSSAFVQRQYMQSRASG